MRGINCKILKQVQNDGVGLQGFHACDTEYLQHALNDALRLSFRGSATTEESP